MTKQKGRQKSKSDSKHRVMKSKEKVQIALQKIEREQERSQLQEQYREEDEEVQLRLLEQEAWERQMSKRSGNKSQTSRDRPLTFNMLHDQEAAQKQQSFKQRRGSQKSVGSQGRMTLTGTADTAGQHTHQERIAHQISSQAQLRKQISMLSFANRTGLSANVDENFRLTLRQPDLEGSQRMGSLSRLTQEERKTAGSRSREGRFNQTQKIDSRVSCERKVKDVQGTEEGLLPEEYIRSYRESNPQRQAQQSKYQQNALFDQEISPIKQLSSPPKKLAKTKSVLVFTKCPYKLQSSKSQTPVQERSHQTSQLQPANILSSNRISGGQRTRKQSQLDQLQIQTTQPQIFQGKASPERSLSQNKSVSKSQKSISKSFSRSLAGIGASMGRSRKSGSRGAVVNRDNYYQKCQFHQSNHHKTTNSMSIEDFSPLKEEKSQDTLTTYEQFQKKLNGAGVGGGGLHTRNLTGVSDNHQQLHVTQTRSINLCDKTPQNEQSVSMTQYSDAEFNCLLSKQLKQVMKPDELREMKLAKESCYKFLRRSIEAQAEIAFDFFKAADFLKKLCHSSLVFLSFYKDIEMLINNAKGSKTNQQSRSMQVLSGSDFEEKLVGLMRKYALAQQDIDFEDLQKKQADYQRKRQRQQDTLDELAAFYSYASAHRVEVEKSNYEQMEAELKELKEQTELLRQKIRIKERNLDFSASRIRNYKQGKGKQAGQTPVQKNGYGYPVPYSGVRGQSHLTKVVEELKTEVANRTKFIDELDAKMQQQDKELQEQREQTILRERRMKGAIQELTSKFKRLMEERNHLKKLLQQTQGLDADQFNKLVLEKNKLQEQVQSLEFTQQQLLKAIDCKGEEGSWLQEMRRTLVELSTILVSKSNARVDMSLAQQQFFKAIMGKSASAEGERESLTNQGTLSERASIASKGFSHQKKMDSQNLSLELLQQLRQVIDCLGRTAIASQSPIRCNASTYSQKSNIAQDFATSLQAYTHKFQKIFGFYPLIGREDNPLAKYSKKDLKGPHASAMNQHSQTRKRRRSIELMEPAPLFVDEQDASQESRQDSQGPLPTGRFTPYCNQVLTHSHTTPLLHKKSNCGSSLSNDHQKPNIRVLQQDELIRLQQIPMPSKIRESHQQRGSIIMDIQNQGESIFKSMPHHFQQHLQIRKISEEDQHMGFYQVQEETRSFKRKIQDFEMSPLSGEGVIQTLHGQDRPTQINLQNQNNNLHHTSQHLDFGAASTIRSLSREDAHAAHNRREGGRSATSRFGASNGVATTKKELKRKLKLIQRENKELRALVERQVLNQSAQGERKNSQNQFSQSFQMQINQPQNIQQTDKGFDQIMNEQAHLKQAYFSTNSDANFGINMDFNGVSTQQEMLNRENQHQQMLILQNSIASTKYQESTAADEQYFNFQQDLLHIDTNQHIFSHRHTNHQNSQCTSLVYDQVDYIKSIHALASIIEDLCNK